MEFLRCFRCMEEAKGYPCTHCGYDPATGKSSDYGLRPGTILNEKYVVGTILGQGGFGITYIGWDLALDCKVAIKEYYPSGQVVRDNTTGSVLHWLSTPQSEAARDMGKEMFLKEARKMTRVRNIPQVVHVHDLFQENDTAYIVMDFVEGQTLKAHLAKTGPLSWEDTKKIFLPAIRAMEQVHQAGLVHRDLSPDNLMLLPDGSVQILDLGAAKDLNVNSGASSMQVAKGGFSPLEQYSQRGGSGPWTDVYAMAATMYFTLTGVVPPNAVDRVDEDPIHWDLPQLVALPQSVLTALQNALVVRSENRTRSMAAFLAQLLPDLSDEDVTKPADSKTELTDIIPQKKKKQAEQEKQERKKSMGSRRRWLIFAVTALMGIFALVLLAIQAGPAPEPWVNNILMADPSDDIHSTVLGSRYERQQILSVTLLDTLENAPRDAWDVSEDRSNRVRAWVTDSDEINRYHLYIAAEGGINAPHCEGLFSDYYLATITIENNCFHTDYATSMEDMFRNCNSLSEIDLSGFETQNVTSMKAMFLGCRGLTSLDLSNLETGNVTTMEEMFYLSGVDRIDFRGLDIRNVTSMRSMFGLSYIRAVDFSGLDARNVTDMSCMFSDCSALVDVNFTNFQAENVTDMSFMFGDASGLTKLDLSSFRTGKLENMAEIFYSCSSLYSLDLRNWDTSHVTNVRGAFRGLYSMNSIDDPYSGGISGINDLDFSSVEFWENFMDEGRTVNGKPWEELFLSETTGATEPEGTHYLPITAQTISAGATHTVAIKQDGSAVGVGSNSNNRRDISDWTDLVAISASYHTVGLRADGTVVAAGSTACGRCDVSDWKNIVAISAKNCHTVGLKADGTVVSTQMGDDTNNHGQCNVSDWTDIVAISAGSWHTVGLKADGTVVATGKNDNGRCDVSDWNNIVAISAGGWHTVGLKADGTVVAIGETANGRCNVTGWTNIVAISAGLNYTVGLKADGTVVAVGYNKHGQCDVSDWTDIVAISAGKYHTIGLKADGTIVSTEITNAEYDAGQDNVSSWTDIRIPGTIS